MTPIGYSVTEETFASLSSYWRNADNQLNWGSVFVLPSWLDVWWQVFRPNAELYLRAIRQQAEIVGIAPLQVKEATVSFVGSTDVCDYMDFVIAPGRETDFFNILLNDLKEQGITRLELAHLRPDSTVLTYLVDTAQKRGCQLSCSPEETSLEMDLPVTWDEYLALLTAKQRHEVKRKLRRLSEVGEVNYYFINDRAAVHDKMDTFLKMFTESRSDKSAFLTVPREAFFRSLADTMAEAGLLSLGILELDSIPAAMIVCFDYNDCIYLYNSGYDPGYSSLSVGLLSKVLCIQDSIQKGRKRFDFLKGKEIYKSHLGGREVPLFRCQITIN